MENSKNSVKTNQWLLVLNMLGDLAVISIGIYLAFIIRFGGSFPQNQWPTYIGFMPLFMSFYLVISYAYGQYNPMPSTWQQKLNITYLSVFTTFICGPTLAFFLHSVVFPRLVYLIGAITTGLISVAWQRVCWSIYTGLNKGRKLLVVGSDTEAPLLAEKLQSSKPYLKVASLTNSDFTKDFTTAAVAVANEVAASEDSEGATLNGTVKITKSQMHECDYANYNLPFELDGVDTLILCSSIPRQHALRIMLAAMHRDVKVVIVPDIYDIMVSGAQLHQIEDTPLFALSNIARLTPIPHIKRIMDIVISSLLLLLSSPILLTTFVAIKLDSPGRALYVQPRVGMNGKEFNIYKFRTMIDDAEHDSGPVFSNANDSRLTRLGRFLRQTRIDELPQLVNVLKGDMSLVGPRPERRFFVEQFEKQIPYYELRHSIPGGLTGLAQVQGKYSTSPEDKLRYDLLYARMYSPILDIKLMLRTLVAVMDKNKSV